MRNISANAARFRAIVLKGGCCGLLRTGPQPCGAACPRQASVNLRFSQSRKKTCSWHFYGPFVQITTVSFVMTFFCSTNQLTAGSHFIHLHAFTTVFLLFSRSVVISNPRFKNHACRQQSLLRYHLGFCFTVVISLQST